MSMYDVGDERTTTHFLLLVRGEGPERADGGMVGGGRHNTPLPSEDVRRGRSTHTLPPFWPGHKHTRVPHKTAESWVANGSSSSSSESLACADDGQKCDSWCSRLCGPAHVCSQLGSSRM